MTEPRWTARTGRDAQAALFEQWPHLAEMEGVYAWLPRSDGFELKVEPGSPAESKLVRLLGSAPPLTFQSQGASISIPLRLTVAPNQVRGQRLR